nr:probable RNA-binding protein 19 [Ciona intestinalis]|eukprot:XP_002128145.1 probable RNA-binding protein 19 [Ciona intestinalis]
MSRLIVKNLPSKINEEKLKKEFEPYGTITDVKLMFSKSGKFRRFAFVGYQFTENADKAKSKLDKSLILNQKISVETCNDFGANDKVKEAFQRSKKNKTGTTAEKQQKKEATDLDFIKANTNSQLKDDDSDDETETPKMETMQFSVKMRGCPFNIKEKQIREFFFPITVKSLNVQKTDHGSRTGFVYVHFKTEEDREAALKHNGDYIKGRYIELFKQLAAKHQGKQGPYYEKAWMKKVAEGHQDCETEDISESGRLYVRNLPYTATEEDLENHFKSFGPLSEVSIPVDDMSKKSVGFGFITYMMPEHALKAFNSLDGTAFQGRMIHILPAKAKVEKRSSENPSDFKQGKQAALKQSSQSSHNWNALFMGTDAVVDALAEKYNGDKSEILTSTKQHTAAVRVALGETLLVQETREFLLKNGISLDAFSQPNAERSKTVIIAKNLPVGSTCSELREMFAKFAELGRVVLAPAGVTAVIECLKPAEAKLAFTKLAYRKFHHSPLYLEWAPVGTFKTNFKEFSGEAESTEVKEDSEEVENTEEDFTIFVKNLNFSTDEESLKTHFSSCGELKSCLISRKKTHKSNALLSMGYGFVCYARKKDGQKALKTLQGTMLDEHKLELKMSERKTNSNTSAKRRFQLDKKQASSKILVRNVPFQANSGEIESLFKSFGELKSVRMPKKVGSITAQAGSHRGFAFVDFLTKQEAKKAFEALCHSTHLYGRRLVLEWADAEEDSVEGLRKKTATHFHENVKRRKGMDDFEEALNSKIED